MTRKKLVTALSIFYIINGLWNIGVFLYQSSGSSKSVYLDLSPLISGVLALYVGFQLLQLHESGRKFAIGLSYVRIAINLYFMIWFFFHLEGVVSTGLYFLHREIYRIDNPYVSEVYLFASILVTLLIVVFLSQGKTKNLFRSVTFNDSNATVESPPE